jgi:hypothetical protein
MRKKDFKCLMVSTSDNRKFFTYEKFYPQLVDFAHTFEADISVVKVEDAEVLSLKSLAEAISDPSKNMENCSFEIIKPQISTGSKDRKNAAAIRKFLRNTFLDRGTASLSVLREKFKDLALSLPCLSNHLNRVKRELQAEGYCIKRTGRGCYSIVDQVIDDIRW